MNRDEILEKAGRKLSQNQLMELVGVSHNTISAIETGQFKKFEEFFVIMKKANFLYK